MITKAQAGYVMFPRTEYNCGDCAAYDADDHRCLYLGPTDVVLPYDGCNYMTKGEPGIIVPSKPEEGEDADGDSAMSLLTPQQAGFARSSFGFSCKRCANFIDTMYDCQLVDKESLGDTPGMISPDACCNAWLADAHRSLLPTEAFS
jgi:hypothetical protein